MGAILQPISDPGVLRAATPAPVVAAAGMTLIGALNVAGGGRYLGIQLAITIAAITGLKITRGLKAGDHDAGLQKDWIVGAALNTPTAYMPSNLPAASIETSAAGSIAQILLDCSGCAEIGIWAQSAGTAKVQLDAIFPPSPERT